MYIRKNNRNLYSNIISDYILIILTPKLQIIQRYFSL